jgi:hypothetical protein
LKVTSSGELSNLAGDTIQGLINGVVGVSPYIRFSYPTGLACDPDGNVYVADYGNNVIRKITINQSNTTDINDEKSSQEKDKITGTSPDLSNTGISEAKAKMLLESMRHEEIQYLQQIKRKANNPDYKGKPNW